MSTLSGEFVLKNQNTTSPSKDPSDSPHAVYPDIQTGSPSFYTSLCIDPQNVTVINQKPDEKIHLLVRRHLITNTPWIFLVLLFALFPLFMPFIIRFFPFIQVSLSSKISFFLLYYLALMGYGLLKFSEWYFQVGIITNKRMIDIDMHNIMSRNVAETHIRSIEDVTYEQKGFLQSLFNYGDVYIQTEALTQNFEFDLIPQPAKVAELMNQITSMNRKEYA